MSPCVACIFGLFLAVFGLARPGLAQVAPVPVYADNVTRHMALQTQAKEVACLRFYGQSFNRLADDAVEIKDPKAIGVFLAALRQANTTRGGFLLMDLLEISFQPVNGQRQEPFQLRFDAHSPLLCVNADFQEALHTFVEPAAAEQVRQLVQANVDKVKGISLYARSHVILTQPDEVNKFLREMEKADARAFSFTRPFKNSLTVYLHFHTRVKEYELDETAVRIGFLPSDSPRRGFSGKPPLPPLLWQYCFVETGNLP